MTEPTTLTWRRLARSPNDSPEYLIPVIEGEAKP